MQQDDQNTFKFHNPTMNSQNPSHTHQNCTTHNPTVVEKANLLTEGINYLVPSFWYDQLIEINHCLKSLQNIEFPPFQTYVNFLRLSGLSSPTDSSFEVRKQTTILTSHHEGILDESNFWSSKTVEFSKFQHSSNNFEIQCNLLNPFLWNLIESKYLLSRYLTDDRTESKKRAFRDSQGSEFNPEELPKIAIFLRKEFILEKGQSKTKQSNHQSCHNCYTLLYKNVKYSVPKQAINQQICNQLKKMTKEQINLTLLIDQSTKTQNIFRKFSVKGFFSGDIPFKQLIKSLIDIKTLKNCENTEKFYIYNHSGQKLAHKITTIQSLYSFSHEKGLIISMTPLEQILDYNVQMKKNLKIFLSKDFNSSSIRDKNIRLQNGKNQRQNWPFIRLRTFFQQVSKKNEISSLVDYIDKCYRQGLSKNQIKSGFKPFNRDMDEQIIRGTFYRSTKQQNRDMVQNQQTLEIRAEMQEIRFLQSVTTNMDTPMIDENQSQKPRGQTNYQNKRLHKHSTYNRLERKKKALGYVSKKKKNNLVLKDNSEGFSKTLNEYNDHKKRVKHPLFLSLVNLDKDQSTLDYLIENMKSVSIDYIYCQENKFIQHPYPQNSQQISNQDEGSQQKVAEIPLFRQRQERSKIKKIDKVTAAHRKKLQHSLSQICRQIELKYEPQIFCQGKKQEQKCKEKLSLQKLQLFQEYDRLMFLKKDNEEIKTIVDNSEGPYPQMQKQSIKIKYRVVGEGLKKSRVIENRSMNEEINYMSDGTNGIENNDETI